MSEIKVHPSYIMETVSIIEKYERALASGRHEISLLQNQLNRKILNRKDIESRLSDAIKSYSLIEGKLRQLHEFVNFAMAKYQAAENEITRKSHELDSLINYSTVHSIRAINPGENPLRTGKDKLRNMLNDLAPLIIMLNPFLLFPITYRNHLNGSPSFHFGKIKETDFYQHVLEKHKLSNEEKIAVQSYAQQQYGIYPIAVKASKKKNSSKKEEAEQEEEGFIGKGIDFLFDFFFGDIATMVAPDSTFGERVIAAGFTFFKPAKLGGMFFDSLKFADSAKDFSKAKKSVENVSKMPPIVQSRINISNDGWKHVVNRHFSKKNASQFTISQAELRSLLSKKEVVNSPVIRSIESADGVRYVRVVTLDKPIGLDKYNNFNPTSTMTVLTDKHGNLVTVFPGVLN